MPRLTVIGVSLFLFLIPLTVFADDEPEVSQTEARQTEEANLEADMDRARAHVKELKLRKREEARSWAQRWRAQQPATHWPQSQPVTVSVEPCPPCEDAGCVKRKKTTFFAEPKIGWSLLNHRSAGNVGLLLGGLVKERVELALSLNILYARGAGLSGADAGLAYGGLDTTVLLVNNRFVRVGIGALLGGGAYVFGRDGGVEYGSVFTAAPHANVEFRPTNWLAVGADGGYRFAVGSPSASMNAGALSGPVVSAYLRFGL